MKDRPFGLVATAAALRSGALSSEALTEQLLTDAEERADLGAFITLDHGRAMRAARQADRSPTRGPLHGVPLAVKDNIHVAGLPNTAATPALKDFVPDADAPVVRRLVAAGAFVLGKTNMHELAYGVTSASSAAGPVRNAHDPTRIAGGSSGGTAVAVTCGVPAGLGTDTGGSVRIPAALCGLSGLRPTPGRYPGGSVTPLSATRDTVGPIAHTVADLALLDAVLSTDADAVPSTHAHTVEAAAPERIRLGIPRGAFTEPLGTETAVSFERAIDRLRAGGIDVVDVSAPDFEGIEDRLGYPIALYEARRELKQYLARHLPALTLAELADRIASPDVRGLFMDSIVDDASHQVTDAHYWAAVGDGRDRLRATYRDLFAGHQLHALVFPTTPRCATPLHEPTGLADLGGHPLPTFSVFTRNTSPGSIAGLPGLTLPMTPAADRLPVGLALDGPPGSDRALLATGLLVERLIDVSGGGMT